MTRIFNSALLLCAILFSEQLIAQSYSKLWDKTYGGTSRDWNCTISTDNQGNLFLAGDSETGVDGDKTVPLCTGISGHSDIWIVKIDSAGSIIWQKDIGGDGDERSPVLVHLNNPDRELLLTCFSTSDTACDKTEPNRDTVPLLSSDFWICLLDSSGMVIWEKTLGGDNYDDQAMASALPTGEIIVSGVSNSPVGYDKTVPNYSISNDLWTLLLDPSGNKIWDKVYGGNGTENLAGIIADPDGSFLLAGTTNSDVSGDVSQVSQGMQDFWIIKVDASGNKMWDKRFGGTAPDICNYAARTADNGYILCGFTVSPQGGDVSEPAKGFQDYWVVKVDSSGNKIWDKRYGGTDGSFGTWISQAQGGGYWVGGYSDSYNVLDVSDSPLGGSDYWFLKIDDSGNKIWDKRLGGNGDEYFLGLALSADSAMYAFGYSDTGTSAIKTAPAKGWLDYWLVKFYYTDSTTSLTEINAETFNFSVMPNPSQGEIQLTFQLQNHNPVELSIHDLSGRLVHRELIYVSKGFNYKQLNLEALRAGGYLLTLRDELGNSSFQKLLIY